ncbi:autotransporter outer membrane beta-barrel domain-containing protein [Amorphus sp. 3PC139-8]
MRRVASSLLFQSTALAGTFAGVPVPIYSRAYAQSVSCTPSQLTTETASNIDSKQFSSRNSSLSGQTISCTISSGTLTTPQYAYGGPYMALINPGSGGTSDAYRGHTYNTHSNWAWDALGVSITNNATITVTSAADIQLLKAQASGSGLYSSALRIAPKQSNALSAVSLGALNWSGSDDNEKTGAGDGGTVTIVNSGDVSSTVGGGIFALSMGGTNKHADDHAAAYPGKGETVTVTSTGAVSGSTFGIAALSIGGPSTYSSDSDYTNGGFAFNAEVTVYDSVKSTGSGPAIAAVSYGGNTPYNLNSFSDNVQGGNGGEAGLVKVTVGTSDKPMSGTISTSSAGSIDLATKYDNVQLTRSTGAGIFAISRGGDGLNEGGKLPTAGNNPYYTYVYVNGTSTTNLETKGSNSPGVLAISQGGASQPGSKGEVPGGSGGKVIVDVAGGGTITTQGDYSSGLVGQSLGGGGTDTLKHAKGLGAASGAVTVTNDFAIITQGIHSAGIVAQSIAAAADEGSAYYSGTNPTTLGDTSTYGSTSGTVTVTNTGDIKVHGADSHGILAQSIGGGGGTLRATATLPATAYGSVSVLNSSSESAGAYQTVGGQAGKAAAGSVYVTNHGDITTYGGYSSNNSSSGGSSSSSSGSSSDSSSSDTLSLGGGIAILAQSLGGGGGTNSGSGTIGAIGSGSSSSSEGDAGSDGAYVHVVNYGTLTTQGSEGHGIVAQSIGGGGGVGRNKKGLFHSVGGQGGAGGDGGKVFVEQKQNSITVSGDYAHGIIAQSVGGGGGVGGQATAWGLFGSSATGGKGGGGGNGGHAQVTQWTQDSSLTTSGDHGTGILVQSIGGGGGVGGNAKSKSIGIGVSVAVSHGGNGANGGNGGSAIAFLNGSVTTKGTDAQALVVQSIGGGGGNGGQASSKATAEGVPVDEDDDTVSLTVSIAHGGSGGAGGSGGEAFGKLYDTATITTYKDGSGAIVAQSIGGGGGNGGDSTASSVAQTMNSLFEGDDDDEGEGPKNFSLNIDVSLGGSGGAAGAGGLVKVYNEGVITTHGGYADGILAQSIGGGGGNGGTGSGSTKKADAIKSAAVNVLIGGYGGGGGDGGTIYSALDGSSASITTYGHVSRGIMAHSIGGGGGNSSGSGGMGDGDWNIGLTIGMGQDGTAGGDGGTVAVWSEGTIVTHGDWSDGILAQSVGGGGGAAGSGTSSLSIISDNKDDDDGGDDNGGDDAEAAEATSVSAVALSASSDDGGDSDGGDDDGDDSDDDNLNLGLTIGMTGGYGGHGGTVTVGIDKGNNNAIVGTGTIKTYGALSSGIVAQSIGGGGGAAAVSSGSNDSDDSDSSSSSSSSSSDSGSGCETSSDGSSSSSSSGSDSDDDKDSCVSLTIGGSGGSGGYGGAVTVHAGSTYTEGFSSHGVVAQSIGGGGGVGISSGLAVDKVHLKLGGGGDGGGGYGGAVTVTTLADTTIQTKGEASHGIVAQSIGAGGGLGMVALGTTSAVNDDTLKDILSVTLGTGADQSGLNTLDGGGVTIDHYGTLSTAGERAVGIVAQSIGAGGGFVTASEAVLSSVSFEKDQSRGASYDASVTLHNGSSIVTTGDGGIGILAQSIGGGGGVAADLNAKLNTYYVAYDQGTYKASDYSGDGRHSSAVTVSVHSGASITTSGNYAHGIIAQSVAGSGGIFEKNGKTYAGSLHRNGANNEASVTVTVDGSVKVTADNAWAVWGQTQNTSVTLTVGSSGALSGSTSSGGNGGAAYAAVDTDGTATLDNSGTVTGNVIVSKGGQTSWSKDYSSSTPAAANGSVQMAAMPGQALFLNQGRGTFVTGAIADVDALLNAGTLNVGGSDRFQQTLVTGDLVGVGTSERGSPYDVGDVGMDRIFSEVSYYAGRTKQIWRDGTTSRGGLLSGIDVDMAAGTSDQLVVRGDFAGSWGAILNPDTLLPNTRVDLLKVQGVDTSDLTVLPTLVFSFTKPTTSSAGWKGFQVDKANFSSTGVAMGRNAAEVSRGLQSAWDKLADGSAQTVSFGRDRISIAETFAAFHAATPEIFEDMLTPIASQTANAPLAGAPQSAIAAANSVLSCPAFTTGVTLQEGECVWGRFLGSRAQQDPMDGASGFKESTTGIQAGGQKMLGNGWFLGGSVSYEESWYKNDAGTEKLDTQSFTGAIALKKEIGPWLFALAGGAGYDWGDSRRYMSIGTLSAVAEAEPKSGFLFGRARASYEFAFDQRIYMRPMVDVDVIAVHQDGYTETGAGGLNLIVDDTTQTVFGVTPGVEFGARVNLSEDLPARLFAGVGVSFLSDDEWETTARFAGLTAMDAFSTYMPINDTIGRVTAGIDLQKTQGMELKLQYDGAFADGYQSHGGSLRFGYRF